MDEFDRSVMVALLPITTDWSTIELPHMTLVYAGQVDDLNETDRNMMAKASAEIAMLNRPIQLDVLGLEVFGEEPDRVEVFRLRSTTPLLKMRQKLERWNASRYPFNPHATIGPVGSYTGNRPPAIAFDRIFFGWGKEDLTFWLKP